MQTLEQAARALSAVLNDPALEIPMTTAVRIAPFIVALERALDAESERVNAWQPIATAPKDGTVFLLGYLPNERIDRRVYEGRWYEFQSTWTSVNGFLIHDAATHWQSLPEPPIDVLAAAQEGSKNGS